MQPVQVERVLKQDSLGRIERVVVAGTPRIRRVASRAPVLGWLARLLLGRERRALAQLAGLSGVPQLVAGAAATRGTLLRSWLPGTPLLLATTLPRDFFDQLERLVLAVHARGVCHNDLHKEANILVADDGRPALIDFQLASVHRRRGRRFAQRAREDLRHVHKHRQVYCRGIDTDAAARVPLPPRSWPATVWRHVWKPFYNALTRRLGLRRLRRSVEARRPRGGPWPRWTDAGRHDATSR